MRRTLALFAIVILLLAFATGALASTGAGSIQSNTTVSTDGSCLVNLVVTVHLEEAVSGLTFPLPGDATNVTLNGSRAGTHRSGDVLEVDLSGLIGSMAGTYTLNFYYTLPDVITAGKTGKLELALPLLSGFAYPIQAMEFTVTLPGEVTARPSFSSGYHQTSIEEDLGFTVTGPTVSGVFTKPLKDHETLTMTLEVTEEMFPRAAVPEWSAGLDDAAIAICAGLALIYWLLFLRCTPLRRVRRSTPPEGITAGELGCALSMQGADLTMMVVTWAQLGYILIQLDENGRVLLHKRMEMGNERSAFELRCFRSLFGKRRMVDGSGLRYAQLCRKVAKLTPNIHDLFLPASGNPKLFRFLAAGSGLFGGVSLAYALAGSSGFRGVLVFLLAVLGSVSAWYLQAWAGSLFLRDKRSLWISLGCGVLWLLLGLIAGELNVAICVVIWELLAGLAAYYGGRRTELGRQTAAQILGLRRYCKTVSRNDLRKICQTNPEYFYTLAPYALAMGVDRAFAQRFGGSRLPGCSYLTSGMDGHMTAMEWSRLMRKVVAALDARQKHLALERLLGK